MYLHDDIMCLLFSLQTRMFQHSLFVWWVGFHRVRGVWRCSTEVSGAPCAMTFGTSMMEM